MQSTFSYGHGPLTIKNEVATQAIQLEFNEGGRQHTIEVRVQFPGHDSISEIHHEAKILAMELMRRAINHMSLPTP